MNSEQIEIATLQHDYDPNNFVDLWQSNPIPVDPIAIYGKLRPGARRAPHQGLQHLDLSTCQPPT